MAKLGVITDGISTDFEHALKVMSDNGLDQAELQYLWDKEVGDMSKSEIDKAEELLKKYNMEVSCISRHNFAGIGVHEVNLVTAPMITTWKNSKSVLIWLKNLDRRWSES